MADVTKQRLRPRYAASSDVGLLRERNEDSFLVFPRHRLAAVADGMGGHMSGDLASALAIATLSEFYATTVGLDRTWPFPYDNDLSDEENCVVVGVRLANQNVVGRAAHGPSESGMGSTIVALMFTPDARQVVVGHVGDSRCYRVRNGRITQLTTDHSLVSEVSEIAPWLSEEEIRQLPSNYITRALGMGPDVVVDLLTTDTCAADLYLLCSDGLNGMLSDEQILETLLTPKDLSSRCRELIEDANDAGGSDNITVVLVEVEAVEGKSRDEVPELFQGGAIAVLAGRPELMQLGKLDEDEESSSIADEDTADE
jgi:serine/threonine protein phosphatase PrpC